jgi:hypothetical protein
MMNTPPKSGETKGDQWRICEKPLPEHTYQQQQECAKKMQDKDQ